MNMFRAPTHLHIGPGQLDQVGAVAHGLGFTRILIVSDPGLAATPWPRRVTESVESNGIVCTTFTDVPTNPRLATAADAAELAKAASADAVVGLGGGSALDTAKACALAATQTTPLAELVSVREFAVPPLPILTIPTTCGTGSEVTWVSVLTDIDRQVKVSVKGESLFPRAAIVDPNVLETLPPHLIAQTGMDALTHALEATTGRPRNPISDALAEVAIGRLLTNLGPALDPAAKPSRALVMEAATIAGLAFGNADVGAVHCLSESIGGLIDTPHGLTNALLLVATLRAHGAAVSGRLAQLQRQTGPDHGTEAANAEALLGRLTQLTKDLELPGFESLGLAPEQFVRVAELATANGSNASNPRTMGPAEYLEILNAVA